MWGARAAEIGGSYIPLKKQSQRSWARDAEQERKTTEPQPSRV